MSSMQELQNSSQEIYLIKNLARTESKPDFKNYKRLHLPL